MGSWKKIPLTLMLCCAFFNAAAEPLVPDRGKMQDGAMTNILISVVAGLESIFDRDGKKITEQANRVMGSCLTEMQNTPPGADFWRPADERQRVQDEAKWQSGDSGKQKASIIGVVLGRHENADYCRAVLAFAISKSKDQKGFIDKLNQGMTQFHKIYNSSKNNQMKASAIAKYRELIAKSVNESGIGKKVSGNSVLALEDRLIENLGGQFAQDYAVTLAGVGKEKFGGDPKHAALTAEEESKIRNSVEALLGDPDAIKKTGLKSEVKMPLPGGGSGTFHECMQRYNQFEGPEVCFQGLIGYAQGAALEEMTHNIPDGAGERKNLTDAVHEAFAQMNWKKKESNAERVLEFTEKTMLDAAVKYFNEANAKLFKLLTANPNLPKLKDLPFQALDEKVLKNGISGLLETEKFNFGAKKPGSLKQCLSETSNESIDGIIGKVNCYKLAFIALQGAALKWVALHFPDGNGKLKIMTDLVHKSAHEVYEIGGDHSHDLENLVLSVGKNFTNFGLAKASEVFQNGHTLAEQRQSGSVAGSFGELQQVIDSDFKDPATQKVLEDHLPELKKSNPAPGNVVTQAMNVPDGSQLSNAQITGKALIDHFAKDPKAERAAAHVFASFVLANEQEDASSKEGRSAFDAAWSEFEKNPGKPSVTFYQKLASQFDKSWKGMDFKEGEKIQDYAQRLNHELFTQKTSEISKPLLSEIMHQATCEDQTTAIPSDISCGCMTKGGTIRTKNGNLFTPQISAFVNLLRFANMPGVVSGGQSCADTVKSALARAPDLIAQNGGQSFFENPLAFLGQGVSNDQKEHPTLTSCMIVGVVQKVIKPKLMKSLPEKVLYFDTFLHPFFDKVLDSNALMSIIEGTHPDLGGDTSINKRYQAMMSDLAAVFTQHNQSGDQANQKDLGYQIKSIFAKGAQDLTAMAVTSSAMAKPVLAYLSGSGGELEQGAMAWIQKIDKGQKGMHHGFTLSDIRIVESCDPAQFKKITRLVMNPIANESAGFAAAILNPDRIKKTKTEEENACVPHGIDPDDIVKSLSRDQVRSVTQNTVNLQEVCTQESQNQFAQELRGTAGINELLSHPSFAWVDNDLHRDVNDPSSISSRVVLARQQLDALWSKCSHVK